MRISQRFLVLSAVLALLLIAPSAASALTQSDLDTSYGGTGKVTPALPTISSGYSMAPQPDGKIVGGYIATGNAPTAFRLNTDGSLDSSFGTGGKVDLAVLGATALNLDRVLVAPDGTIYLVGDGTSGALRDAIWALTPTGSPKLSFNGTGSILLPSASGDNDLGDAALTASGSVAVLAQATPGADDSFSIRVVSPTGVVTATGLRTFVGYDGEPTSLAVLPDGRFVASVLLDDGTTTLAGMISFSPAGVFDATWGSGGGFAIFGPPVPLVSMAFRTFNLNGRLATVGMVGYVPTVEMHSTAGALIPEFGSGGVFRLLPPGASFAYLVDGIAVGSVRIAATGSVLGPSGRPPFVVRFNPDGTADTSFAPNGIADLPVAAGDGFPQLVLQPDGKYVIAVWSADNRLSFLRMWGDHPAPQPAPPAVPAVTVITSLTKKTLKASKTKRFAGTASGTGLVKVELAIQKVDSKLLKKSKKCRYVKLKSGALKKFKAKSGKCSPGIWLKASGTTKWSLKLTKALKPGKYVVSARSTGVLGVGRVVKKSITLTK